MMTFFSLSAILNGFSCLFLGFFALFKNRKNIVNQTYFYFAFCVGIWSLGYIFWPLAKTRDAALNSFRILHLGAVYITVCYYHFICALTGKIRENKKVIILGYLLATFFVFFIPTRLFIQDMVPKFIFRFWANPGILYHFYLVFFFSYVLLALVTIFSEYKKSFGEKKKQYAYILAASFLGYLGGSTNYPLWYNIPIYPVANILVTLYVGLSAYAIVKYHLMDIRIAITRTGIFVAVYSVVLGLPFAMAGWFRRELFESLGANWWILPLTTMAILATAGPFIYIYFERRAEDRLLREQRQYQSTLKQASIGMTRIRNLTKLLNLIAHIVTKTVHISYASIYLYDREKEGYVLQVCRDKGRVPIPVLSHDNPLIRWIMSKKQSLICDEIKRKADETKSPVYRELEDIMKVLYASVIIPSYLEDKPIGFLVLGEKVSGHAYTLEDLNVFEVLASQAALAIENAQFYEEAKEMQAQISQAEKMATIGTMADGLSHQINNRFHALSLIAGDTIDTIKLTDSSKCTPEVKDMLKQINYALSRIQSNVIQGGEVVKGILKYTRKSEEGFEAVGLDQIIDSTIEMVQYKVKLSEVDIVRNYPSDIPKLYANVVQLQEAFFNFIDNAYEAITERRDLLKESEYRGRITIFATPKEKSLEIIIEDNGIGVKEENYKKVFTPFFTTKTSTRKGTGLGLYVINKIITDTHKGKLSFESEYKIGTRFIMELPRAA
jgi:signal transduction histidine kinase